METIFVGSLGPPIFRGRDLTLLGFNKSRFVANMTAMQLTLKGWFCSCSALKKNSPSIGGWKHNWVLRFLDANQQIPPYSRNLSLSKWRLLPNQKKQNWWGEMISVTIARATCNLLGCFLGFICQCPDKNGNISFQQEMSIWHWLNRRISASWCWPWKSSCKTWVPKYTTTFVRFTQNKWLLYIPPPPTRCLVLTRCIYIFWYHGKKLFGQLLISDAYPAHRKWRLTGRSALSTKIVSSTHRFWPGLARGFAAYIIPPPTSQ